MVDQPGSALVILLPAVERIVGAWRARLDPSAAAGVPAHVTIRFPWVPRAGVDDSVLHDLAGIVAAVPRFEVVFPRVGWFDRDVLWLEPDPQEPFISLAAEVARRWPDHPPYAGRFESFVPHVTVAVGSSDKLDRVADILVRALPIRDVVTQLWWITRSGTEPWMVRTAFDLA